MRNPFAVVPVEIFGIGMQAQAICVFTALATFADRDRYAFPSVATLAKMVGLSERQTRTHLRALEDVKAISVVKRHDESGRQTSNGYCLDMLKISAPPEVDFRHVDEADFRGEGEAHFRQTIPEGTVPEEQLFPAKQNEVVDFRPKAKPTKTVKKTSLSDDWDPDDDLLNWAHEKHPKVDVLGEVEQFRDYHIARANRMADWRRAFQTWVRNADRFSRNKQLSPDNRRAERRESRSSDPLVTYHQNGQRGRRMDFPPA